MAIQPVILTSPRRRAEHVDTICAAFSGALGFAAPLVYCDEDGQGSAISTREALALAGTIGSHVLFLEDDVLVDHEAPSTIAGIEFPPCVAVIAFCDMREVAEFSPRGLYRRNPLGSDRRGWWGNQAILIHQETIAMCTKEDWFSPAIENSPGVQAHKAAYLDNGRNCSDIRMALLIDGLGGERRDYAVHVPSLFKHIGHDSECFPGRSLGERGTRNWIVDWRRYSVESVAAGDGSST